MRKNHSEATTHSFQKRAPDIYRMDFREVLAKAQAASTSSEGSLRLRPLVPVADPFDAAGTASSLGKGEAFPVGRSSPAGNGKIEFGRRPYSQILSPKVPPSAADSHARHRSVVKRPWKKVSTNRNTLKASVDVNEVIKLNQKKRDLRTIEEIQQEMQARRKGRHQEPSAAGSSEGDRQRPVAQKSPVARLLSSSPNSSSNAKKAVGASSRLM